MSGCIPAVPTRAWVQYLLVRSLWRRGLGVNVCRWASIMYKYTEPMVWMGTTSDPERQTRYSKIVNASAAGRKKKRNSDPSCNNMPTDCKYSYGCIILWLYYDYVYVYQLFISDWSSDHSTVIHGAGGESLKQQPETRGSMFFFFYSNVWYIVPYHSLYHYYY